jgi:hypothetical protein
MLQPSADWRRRAHRVAAAALLALLELVLYRKVLRLWWTYDDPNILHIIGSIGLRDPFVSGAVWPQQLFTPLLMTAFQVELLLFDVNTWWWYATQLVLGCAAAIVVYAAAREFLDAVPALSAAALFTAGPPFCSVVTQLSTLHYFLAIILGGLAVIVFVRGRRWASVLLYLGAMLAKEVAVPLPLLLLALPARDARETRDARSRLRATAGHWIAAAVYLLWRRLVIGTFLGAYSWVIEPGDWPRLLATLPWHVLRAMAGSNPWLGLPLVAIVVGIALLPALLPVRRNRHRLLLLGVALVVALGPLLPVAKEVNRRYVLVPWLAASIAFAWGASRLVNRRLSRALLVLVPLLAVTVNRQEWGNEFHLRQRMSDEARVFFEMPPNGFLRLPATPPAVMRELNWVKLVYMGRVAGASWFYDDYFLCAHGIEGKRVWEFDPKILSVVEITPRLAAIAQTHCRNIRADAPLDVAFHYERPALHWDFGPYAAGRYHVLVADGWETFDVPRREALYIPGVTALSVRVRYDAPQGWVTYSPAMVLDFSRGSDFRWQRSPRSAPPPPPAPSPSAR